jgi:hypothetical protein
VTILPLAGMQVKVQVTDERAAFIFVIPNAEDLDVFMPENVIFAVLCFRVRIGG